MGYILDLRKVVGTRPLIMAGACVLVFNNENQLLLQCRTDTLDWGTIGGSMEPGESFEETAKRELFEEAGLKARSLEFINIYSGQDMYYKYRFLRGMDVANTTTLSEITVEHVNS
ncbi:NUDIX hydrolase [Paenibacillus sp. HJGM_3]|uniref:NUDIX hydrolase n=1 Tax=Paenibacillus sp. HJGM_3 TaxID=3379816 RepID=UPI00386DC9DA